MRRKDHCLRFNSMAVSHVWLGLPGGRFQSDGVLRIAAATARSGSSSAALRAMCSHGISSVVPLPCWQSGYTLTLPWLICASMSTAAFQKFWIPLALSSRPNCRPGGKWWQPIPPGLWLTPPAGWLPRTGISSWTLRSVIEYRLPFYFCVCIFISES